MHKLNENTFEGIGDDFGYSLIIDYYCSISFIAFLMCCHLMGDLIGAGCISELSIKSAWLEKCTVLMVIFVTYPSVHIKQSILYSVVILY